MIAAIAVMVALVGDAFAHGTDQIARERVAALRYGESTYDDAVDIFGDPTSKRRINGCWLTLIAKWPGIKLWFDRSEPGKVPVFGIVRSRDVPTSDGGSLAIHTGRGLRVEDTVKRLKRLYPDTRSTQGRGDKRQWQLAGRNQDAFLVAISEGGRVIRLLSGFNC